MATGGQHVMQEAPERGELVLRLRIRVVSPPPGVAFAVQMGRSELTPPQRSGPDEIPFEITARLRPETGAAGFTFAGDYVQGPPRERFVYINSGVRAGQRGSPWDRRAKLKLGLIPRSLLHEAAGDPGVGVEASFAGTGADGGPVCANLAASAIEWRLVQL